MPSLLVRHKIADFEHWKSTFNGAEAVRRANGSLRETFFRNSDQPDEIWVLLEWDDLFRARLFVKSDELMDAMLQSGLVDRPDYWYLEEE